MAKCELCGNDYDKSFEVRLEGRTHVFDSFECAIHALAPMCSHCGCRVIGHGVEEEGQIFCCVHCARRVQIDEPNPVGLARRSPFDQRQTSSAAPPLSCHRGISWLR